MADIIKNKYGFYSVKSPPTKKELTQYYRKKYYQNEDSPYPSNYTTEERQHIINKIEQKHAAIDELMTLERTPRLLDVGCGEGFCLDYFSNLNWEILGIDFSEFGIKKHHAHLLDNFVGGDIQQTIKELTVSGQSFDLIWLDNVLEHVIDPLEVVKKCHSLASDNGVLLIEVPNDFSVLQLAAKSDGLISNDFWVVFPDHLSYFNKDGLASLCAEGGWIKHRVISDFPIDFNLFNPKANYVDDATKGKGAHLQRVKLDNLIHEISIEKANNFFESLADLGLGRQIIGIFKK